MEPQNQEQEFQNQEQELQLQEKKDENCNKKYKLLIKIGSKRRTWVTLFVVVYGIIFYFSWNFLQSTLRWYHREIGNWGAAVYAAAVFGAIFGVMSMAAAFAVAVPAMVVTWISILVLLAFFGKSRRDLIVEGRKLTAEIFGIVARVLIKEGNFVAAVCAVFGYVLLVRRRDDHPVAVAAAAADGI